MAGDLFRCCARTYPPTERPGRRQGGTPESPTLERALRVTAVIPTHFLCWNRHTHQGRRGSSHENALLKPGTYDVAPGRRAGQVVSRNRVTTWTDPVSALESAASDRGLSPSDSRGSLTDAHAGRGHKLSHPLHP